MRFVRSLSRKAANSSDERGSLRSSRLSTCARRISGWVTAIGLAACLQNSPAAAETERLWLSNCLAIHDDVEAMETAFLSSGFRHSRPEDHEKIAELLVLSSLATSVLNNTSDQILEGWDKLYELNREVLSLPPYVEGGPSRGIQVRVFLDETSIVRVSFEDDEQWGKSTNCDIYLGGPYPGWMLGKLESAFKKAHQHGAV